MQKKHFYDALPPVGWCFSARQSETARAIIYSAERKGAKNAFKLKNVYLLKKE